MSCNRENVIWQSQDGSWNRAFYAYFETGDTSDPDYDYEWDVEYTDDFNWVVVGLPSMEAAENAWDGANPGGWDCIDTPSEATNALDAKAAAWLAKHPPAPRPRYGAFSAAWR